MSSKLLTALVACAIPLLAAGPVLAACPTLAEACTAVIAYRSDATHIRQDHCFANGAALNKGAWDFCSYDPTRGAKPTAGEIKTRLKALCDRMTAPAGTQQTDGNCVYDLTNATRVGRKTNGTATSAARLVIKNDGGWVLVTAFPR